MLFGFKTSIIPTSFFLQLSTCRSVYFSVLAYFVCGIISLSHIFLLFLSQITNKHKIMYILSKSHMNEKNIKITTTSLGSKFLGYILKSRLKDG